MGKWEDGEEGAKFPTLPPRGGAVVKASAGLYRGLSFGARP